MHHLEDLLVLAFIFLITLPGIILTFTLSILDALAGYAFYKDKTYNTNCKDNNIWSYESPDGSKEYCADMCDQYLFCASFVYDTSSGYCTLNEHCKADSTTKSSGKKFYEKGMIAQGSYI